MTKIYDLMMEVLIRITRVETRLVRLAEALKVEVKE